MCSDLSSKEVVAKKVNQIRNNVVCFSSPCFRVLLCTHYGALQCVSTYFRKSKEIGVLRPIFPEYLISCNYDVTPNYKLTPLTYIFFAFCYLIAYGGCTQLVSLNTWSFNIVSHFTMFLFTRDSKMKLKLLETKNKEIDHVLTSLNRL